MPRPCLWVLALGAVICGAPRAALADGTVSIESADISAGAGAPPGLTLVDQLAPPAAEFVFAQRQSPAPLPVFTSNIPAMPAFVGAAPDFVAVTGTTTTLEAGTHDFATFRVEGGAAVECLGPVTIRVKGAAYVGGEVVSPADGGSIAFQCGADFTMSSGSDGTSSPIVVSFGLDSPISIDAAGNIVCDAAIGANGTIRAASGDVVLRQRGALLLIRRVDVVAHDGRVDVRSPDAVRVVQSEIRAGGDLELRAFGGTLEATHTSFDAAGTLRVLSTGRLTLDRVAAAAGGVVDVASMGERLYLTDSTMETSAGSVGDLSLQSRQHMFILRSTVRHRGSGTLAVGAGSDVVLEYPGIARTSSLLHEGIGSVRVLTDSMFIAYGDSVVSAPYGDVVVHADFIEVNGPCRLSAPRGVLDLNSGGTVRLRADPTGAPEPLPAIAAWTVRISGRGGSGTQQLYVERADAGPGGVSVTTRGRTFLRGTFSSAGPVTIRGSGGVLDLTDADISTTATSGSASAPVIVERTNDASDSSIVATGARIRSGDAAGAPSGDVVLLLRRYSPPYWTTWGLDFEDGVPPAMLGSAAIDAHSARIAWIPREPDATGLLVERAEEGGEFSAVATLPGDAVYFVDEGLAPDTAYLYRLSVLSASLRSIPTDGVYVRTQPNVRVRVLRAAVVDKPERRRDTVAISLKLRFLDPPAEGEFDPASAPLRIAVGDAFTLSLPANDARWTQEGRVFAWTGPVGFIGEATVRIDPASGRLDVKAKGIGIVQPDADRSFVRASVGGHAGSKSLRKRARK